MFWVHRSRRHPRRARDGRMPGPVRKFQAEADLAGGKNLLLTVSRDGERIVAQPMKKDVPSSPL